MKQKLMGWQPENADNRYAFGCGVAAYLWQVIMSVQHDVVIGMIKAALFGVAGMVGKEIWALIKKAYVSYLGKRKHNKDVGKNK